MHRRKLKTMKDWEREANGNCQYSWYDYAKPGDLVDESVFIYFMDVTTPRIYRHSLGKVSLSQTFSARTIGAFL